MRISATTLESFRLFMQADQEWMSEAELIASIKGEFTPTPAVLIGKAFGQVLETPERFIVPHGFRCGDYTFSQDTMAPALALMDRRGVFEAKAQKRYGDCDVVARADQIVGARLIEHKTTCSTFQFEKYAESYQWRFMADIFLPAVITYHVFCLDDDHENGVVELRDIHTFNLFPYASLQDDCWALLREFQGFVTAKGLDALLRARQRQHEAA